MESTLKDKIKKITEDHLTDDEVNEICKLAKDTAIRFDHFATMSYVSIIDKYRANGKKYTIEELFDVFVNTKKDEG